MKKICYKEFEPENLFSRSVDMTSLDPLTVQLIGLWNDSYTVVEENAAFE